VVLNDLTSFLNVSVASCLKKTTMLWQII